MDIDTVTKLTTATSILKTALSATVSKTRSKMVQFNAIADVKIIECRLQSWTKTAKKNKQKLKIATTTSLVIVLCNWSGLTFYRRVQAMVQQTQNQDLWAGLG